MKKPLTFLFALTFLLLVCTTAITVVSGETKEFNFGTGTGFFLNSSNYIVTNYHVIHGSKNIKVELVNGQILDAEVALKSSDKDIAILKLNGTPSVKRMKVKFSKFSEIRTGDKVFTYGFSMTEILGHVKSKYSEGVINSLKGVRRKQDDFQFSIPLQKGNSGGAIFNEQGQLVGIATYKVYSLRTKEYTSFGVKSSVLADLLSEIPEILQLDIGNVSVQSEQNSLRDFKEDIKNNIVFVFVKRAKKIDNNHVAMEAYFEGDYKTAFEMWKKIAGQGDALAQNYLGLMYQYGTSVLQDYATAYMWLSLSGSNGNKVAEKNRNIIETKMSPSQIEKAQEMIRNWKPKTK